MIQFFCDGCRRQFQVPVDWAGMKMQCITCGVDVHVPRMDPLDELESPHHQHGAAYSPTEPTPCLIRTPKSRWIVPGA